MLVLYVTARRVVYDMPEGVSYIQPSLASAVIVCVSFMREGAFVLPIAAKLIFSCTIVPLSLYKTNFFKEKSQFYVCVCVCVVTVLRVF